MQHNCINSAKSLRINLHHHHLVLPENIHIHEIHQDALEHIFYYFQITTRSVNDFEIDVFLPRSANAFEFDMVLVRSANNLELNIFWARAVRQFRIRYF